ncbi:MAG: sugar phosphate isomerase/epimerase [Acidobacteriota bacterium]|nr:sugar phosphate isomerase/epimerase [Acidobacteriota bacterium]MDQ3168957.1 sugar phosphate isomerase/epimerase [Acidobacteriota bacterium]
MTFGISTHLFHDERLSEAHLALVKQHGFDRVEIFATRSHVDYTSDAAAGQIATWLANNGLTLHSVHAPITNALTRGAWGDVWSIASSNAAVRQTAVSEGRQAIAFASALGARFVVVHLGVPDSMKPPAPDNDGGALARSLETLAAEARARRITLALEVIPNRLSTPDALAARLEDAADAAEDPGDIAALGVCLDSGHAHMMGGAVDAIESLGGHIVTTHLHDNDAKQDDHRVPFQGTINWSALVMAMEKVGYDGVWMFEVAAPEGGAGVEQTLAKAAAARDRLARLNEPIEFTL